MQTVAQYIDFESMAQKVNACVDLAKKKKILIFYSDIESATGVLCASETMRRILNERMIIDHEAGLPLASSLVVAKETRMPGKGYFTQARECGYLIPRSLDAELKFWVKQTKMLEVR